jgi:eukaryotic-like serine/threonine-protein kinase
MMNWHEAMAQALEQLKSAGAASAEPLLRKALELTGDSAEFKAMTYFNLALVQYDLKRPQETEASFAQAIEIIQDLLPKQNELYGMFLKTMIEFYEKEDRLADADRYYHMEIELTKEMYGARHPYVANIISEYAETQVKLASYAGAEKNLRRALEIMIAARGANHVQLGPIHASLAKCYAALERQEDAEYHQDRADELEAKARKQRSALVEDSGLDDETPTNQPLA